MFGVEIHFKNGKKQWIDPVKDEPTEINGVLTVANNLHSYDYDAGLVLKWIKYDLCNICFYDTRAFGCTANECQNKESEAGNG